MREGGRGAANLSVAAPGASRSGVAAWRAWRLPLRTTSAACAGGARAVRMVVPRRCVALRRGSIARVVRRACVCGHRRRDASGKPARPRAHPRIRASAFRLRNGGGQRGRCAQMSFLTAPPRRAGGIATASLV
ncbi:hypothetical protein AQ802_06280 [Burkholderia pseudomallei]|uniref:Uncharacterized protein n=3 Tax=Burkholderia pseudomallei TaxID=28450 RepID=A0AAX0U6X8_BURPE|nr:hypothetical protein BURPS1106A_A1053 [Burkholderia pseudomallei 1106a]AFR19010.1 hypothetical protein BPC006_II1081 [Burkholderia pseudomallei BPC006]EES23118.1 hypothetical protein BURPS1106B_0936 [Burkholderia pseudomallei 1106b]EET05661.1 conserved hypothetical protein [Burkholderia pseudomallei 1710a]OMR22425.1 hypothetical protein AQ722_22730 [Burkholderia pseudomallei]